MSQNESVKQHTPTCVSTHLVLTASGGLNQENSCDPIIQGKHSDWGPDRQTRGSSVSPRRRGLIAEFDTL